MLSSMKADKEFRSPPTYLNRDITVRQIVKAILKTENKAYLLDEILKVVSTQTPCRTVNELRFLSDKDWLEIQVPAMFKAKLQEILHSSVSLNRLEELEFDFNLGERFDLSQFNNRVEKLVDFGFDRFKALEAAIILKENNLNDQLEFLFLDKSSQREIRNREESVQNNCKVKKNTTVLKNKGDSNLIISSDRSVFDSFQGIELNTLAVEWRSKLRLEISNTAKFLERAEKKDKTIKNLRYKSFLEGLLLERQIHLEKQAKLEEYRSEFAIDDFTHAAVLKAIGLTEKSLETLRLDEFSDVADLCCICFDNEKNYLVIGGSSECMHLCVCGDCANILMSAEAPKCPVCYSLIFDVREGMRYSCRFILPLSKAFTTLSFIVFAAYTFQAAISIEKIQSFVLYALSVILMFIPILCQIKNSILIFACFVRIVITVLPLTLFYFGNDETLKQIYVFCSVCNIIDCFLVLAAIGLVIKSSNWEQIDGEDVSCDDFQFQWRN